MKLNIITLTFILIIGTFAYSEEIFPSGGFGISPQAQFSAFNSMETKPQPKINADASFFINSHDAFSAGLYTAFIYTLSSNLDGGWSYPGFSGIEAGIELLLRMPFFPDAGLGASASAGLYRYNLTSNIFFLPSCTVFPSLRLFDTDKSYLSLQLPVSFYFHKQADIFISTGLKIRLMMM